MDISRGSFAEEMFCYIRTVKTGLLAEVVTFTNTPSFLMTVDVAVQIMVVTAFQILFLFEYNASI